MTTVKGRGIHRNDTYFESSAIPVSLFNIAMACHRMSLVFSLLGFFCWSNRRLILYKHLLLSVEVLRYDGNMEVGDN